MKKIIILTIALLSTGIVFSAISGKKQVTVKPIEVKIQKSDFTSNQSGNINKDAIATAD